VKRVSLRRAKAQLSRLLKEVALGEQVVLLRSTEPGRSASSAALRAACASGRTLRPPFLRRWPRPSAY